MNHLPETPEDHAADPYSLLETPGMVAGFIWKQAGEAGLRQLLGHPDGTFMSREYVTDIACELSAVGLSKAAAIAAEIAASKLPEDDLSFCPYTKPPYAGGPGNEVNIRAWQAQQRRQSNAAPKRQRPHR